MRETLSPPEFTEPYKPFIKMLGVIASSDQPLTPYQAWQSLPKETKDMDDKNINGQSGANSYDYHLRRLFDMGYIQRQEGDSRRIVPTQSGTEFIDSIANQDS